MAKRDFTARRKPATRASQTKYYDSASAMMQQRAPEKRYRGTRDPDAYQNWYDLDQDKVGPALQDLVKRIDLANTEIVERHMRYARMYGNYEALGWSMAAASGFSQQSGNKPVFNIVQSCVDTVHSKVARDNPSPYFITSGADYFTKLKAEHLTKFVAGIFEQANLYEHANNDVFRDASVYGLGALQFRIEKKDGEQRITCEWVFIDEIKVDRYDGAKRKPRSLHRMRMQPREELLERFRGNEAALEKIERVSTQLPGIFRNQDSVVDMVTTMESWHLPLGKDKPGRYVETLAGEVLTDEKYEDDYFPLIFFRFYSKPAGFWGRGITEAIYSGQVEINKILRFIQENQEMVCTPFAAVPEDAAVSEDALMSNLIGRLIKYRGSQPPVFVSPQGCSQEVYSHLQSWIGWCYQEVGISQTSAGGEKQAGVNSAVAMRTMVDVESSRFIQVSKNWERFFVDCAELVVKLAKKIYEKNDKFKIRYTDKRSKLVREIPWSKVDAPDDVFTVQCDTVSAFPQTAAGRIQTITDFIQNQFISKQRGMELLGQDPDLEGEIRLQTASLRECERVLTAMVEDGVYEHPEKYGDLKLQLSVSLSTYEMLKTDRCPEDRLELVRQWIDELCTLLGAPDPQTQLIAQMFQSVQPEVGPAPQAPVGPPAMPQAA